MSAPAEYDDPAPVLDQEDPAEYRLAERELAAELCAGQGWNGQGGDDE
jgi:hypothetical protein